MKVKSYIGEIWIDIEGYEGLYQVSNFGRVKSLGNDKSRREKILKTYIDGTRHLRVNLSKNGVEKQYYIHQLVAQHFMPNPDNKPELHHIDHNPENNRVDNLVWLTHEEHKAEHPEVYEACGKAAKKTNSKHINQFTLDGLFLRALYSSHDIQRELGYYQQNIIQCCKGKLKTAYGFKWKYADEE